MSSLSNPRAINIRLYHAEAKEDVARYHDINNATTTWISMHPQLDKSIIYNTIFKRYNVTAEWFDQMQNWHYETLNDIVKRNKQ